MSTGGRLLRTFVALSLPADVLRELERLQRNLARAGAGRSLRLTRPGGIHITLRFIGDTPESSVPAIAEALTASLAGASSPRLELGMVGVFPDPRVPRVVWVGLDGDLVTLSDLHRRVEAALRPLGYPAERRPFSPHLTIARVADFASAEERRSIGALVRGVPRPDPLAFRLTEVSLMSSELGPGGARYTPLASVGLS